MSNAPDSSDNLEQARNQGKKQVESIVEMVQKLNNTEDTEKREKLRRRICEDPLSVQIRSGWTIRGEKGTAREYKILLCTGGPVCRIVGTLGEFSEPDSARVEVQGWFTEWTTLTLSHEEEESVLEYARQFWFGE